MLWEYKNLINHSLIGAFKTIPDGNVTWDECKPTLGEHWPRLRQCLPTLVPELAHTCAGTSPHLYQYWPTLVSALTPYVVSARGKKSEHRA